MGEYLADYPSIQAGYNSDIFDVCVRRLTDSLRSRGYLKATLGQRITEVEGRGLVLIIPVDEGVLYRLGEIRIDGAEAIAPRESPSDAQP